jgi:type I restriction enzyme, S subunit
VSGAKHTERADALRRFRPYPAYKDSGVEWLGEIPTGWEVKRLKFVARIEAGQSPPSEMVSDGSDGLPFLQGNGDFGSTSPAPHQVCDAAPKRSQTGDILFSVRAPVGAMNVGDQPYGIGRGLCAVRLGGRFEPRFGFYTLATTRTQLGRVATGSTYDAVTTSQVGDLPALLPFPAEQHAVAAFLYRETAKIDALVAKKERLIDLLQEKRTALITRAVTKGLEPNASMKDSGVEWLGKIPAHWEVKRLWHLTPSGRRIMYGIVLPGPNVATTACQS